MEQQVSGFAVKKGLAQMLKGGVIMDVVTAEHARIAEDAGAVAVMALERVPADIRASGGVARMSDPELILRIMETVSIPVMAKCRIGHLWKHRFWKRWAWIILMSPRCLPRRMKRTTSTSTPSRCRLCAAAATWAKPYDAWAKARP